MPVLALNLHAGFACRHSGACCTAGWPIPVEAAAADAIRAHACLPGTALSTAGPLPDGAAAVLEPLTDGVCPAFDRAGGNLCSVQARLGYGGLPASCRHFPRVALLESDAVRVTLSHFCPTAAWLLLTPAPERLAIVRDAAGIADRREHEGFDARRTIPPFLRPGVVMDAGTCRVWERRVIGALDSDEPAGLAEADLARVLPLWAAHARPVRRYLAARAFAAWSAYLGEGVRTQVAMLAVALAVVRVEAARGVSLALRPLDDAMLHAAIRSADLLLHHLSDAAALVGSLAGVERGPAQAFLQAIGLEATR